MLDDKYITTAGFVSPPGGSVLPSYKRIAHHYFRLRLLQSEILQVLQHRQTQQVRASGASRRFEFMHTRLPCPFLQEFHSFQSWRADIDYRLWCWKEEAPSQLNTGVQFSPLFLELNYWQAVIMLYRQSLTVPPVLADELGPTNGDVQSHSFINLEEREDEERIFLRVAEAGQKVLKLYRQLHRVHLVNYTFLATHHLFMAGIQHFPQPRATMLTGIRHLISVRNLALSNRPQSSGKEYLKTAITLHRSRAQAVSLTPVQSLDDVDFTVLAATSVLGDLIEKCPPAVACRDAFDRMSKATIQMCLSTTGFGSQALDAGLPRKAQPTGLSSSLLSDHNTMPIDPSLSDATHEQPGFSPSSRKTRRPQPHFDMDFKDLFRDHESGQTSKTLHPMPSPQQSLSPSLKHEQTYHTTASRVPPRRHQTQKQHQPSSTTTTATATSSSPLLPHQRQQSQPQVSPYQISNQLPYTTFAQSIQSAYPDVGSFSNLDFLDSFPVCSEGVEGGGPGGAANTDAAADGLDLGFGLELDANHDWADGNGIDLFDGFFFRG